MATQLNTEEISAILQEKIKQLDIPSSPVSEGKVVSVKDGVVEIYGLKHVMSGELLTLAHNTQALALNLEEDSVSAVLLNNQNEIAKEMWERTRLLSRKCY